MIKEEERRYREAVLRNTLLLQSMTQIVFWSIGKILIQITAA